MVSYQATAPKEGKVHNKSIHDTSPINRLLWVPTCCGGLLALRCISLNSYANHLAECSHLHRLPGGPMSHGKSECECPRGGVEFVDASAPAGLNPNVFVFIFFQILFAKILTYCTNKCGVLILAGHIRILLWCQTEPGAKEHISASAANGADLIMGCKQALHWSWNFTKHYSFFSSMNYFCGQLASTN